MYFGDYELKQAYVILNKLAEKMEIDKFYNMLINLGIKPKNIEFYVPGYEFSRGKCFFSWHELNFVNLIRDWHFRVKDVIISGEQLPIGNTQITIKID